jgi:hypothetical protein
MNHLRLSGAGILAVGLMAGCAGPDLDALVPAFRGELARLAREAESVDRIAITGLDGWMFFDQELRHVSLDRLWGADATAVPRSRPADDADPLPAIMDIKRQLDELGVELLLVPVPPKAVVFPEKISDGLQIPIPVPRLDPNHQQFFDRLRAEGLDVLDLTKLFIAERFHPEGTLYCRTDTHWSGSGCVVAASAIAAEVRDRPWYNELETRSFGATWYSTSIVGDLTQDRGIPAPREEVRLRGIVTRTESGLAPVDADQNSPIVLLGDSYNLVFHAGGDMHATGAGLPDQLAFELGLGIDIVAVRGSGATTARVQLLRRAQAAPDYWDRKQLVIWCFAAQELTESDSWRIALVQ